MTTHKGLFIVFEGIDRSGKTTLSHLLYDHLISNSISLNDVKLIRFPDRTNHTGVLINQVLTGNKDISKETIHLLFSANRWENARYIQTLLDEGRIVICDRYSDSGIVYSIAKGLDEDWCRKSDEGLPRPDFIFFIDVDPSVTETRSEYGNEIFENREFQNKVYDTYKRSIGPNWIVLDGTKNQYDLLKDVLHKIG